jgi:hypothetical protein
MADPTLAWATNWGALTTNFARIVALGGVALVIGLVAALLLTLLFGTGDYAESAWPEPSSRAAIGVPCGEPIPAPTRPGLGFPEQAEPVLVTAAPRAESAVANPLRGVGFSTTDVVALEALRQRILAGEVSERPTRPEHVAFARWLVEHGRLSG